MTPASLAIVLAIALAALAVVVNHVYARLALVELALNEGLPPGYPTVASTAAAPPELAATQALDPGVHVFLSRSCHACQRLIDELDQIDVEIEAPIHLHYVDRPRPLAASAAARQGARLHDNQSELTAQLGADPLPYTIAIGDHALIARAVTPTVAQLLVTSRDAGIAATTPLGGQ